LNSGFCSFPKYKAGTQMLYCLCHTSSPFCSCYFGDGISWPICLADPSALASQVTRITGVSYLLLAPGPF
jgi:hypothetical protein